MIVSLAYAKSYLRIENDDEDNVIKNLITQAQAQAELFCRVEFEELDEIPEGAKLAVMLMVSHYYENRDNYDTAAYNSMRKAFENLLYPLRDPEKMF